MNCNFKNSLHILFNKRDLSSLCLNWTTFIVFFVISFILCSREMYTSPDDLNYIAYFANDNVSDLGSVWFYILEEPIWLHYASFMGQLFGPELAFRITIFFSSFMFLFACNKIARGAWVFLLLAFIIDYSLATLLFYIQIRIGLAMAFFFFLASIGLNPILAAIFAATFHTSFIIAIPCTILTYFSRRSYVCFFAAIVTIVLGSYCIKDVIGVIDIGRRAETYEMIKTTNISFYVFAILQYGLIFLVYNYIKKDKQLYYWFHFSLLFFIISICLTFLHEAASRLLFISNAIVMVLLAANIKKNEGKLGASLWLILLLLLIINQFLSGDLGPDSWIYRWRMILS